MRASNDCLLGEFRGKGSEEDLVFVGKRREEDVLDGGLELLEQLDAIVRGRDWRMHP